MGNAARVVWSCFTFYLYKKNPGEEEAVLEAVPGYPQEGLCEAGVEKRQEKSSHQVLWMVLLAKSKSMMERGGRERDGGSGLDALGWNFAVFF